MICKRSKKIVVVLFFAGMNAFLFPDMNINNILWSSSVMECFVIESDDVIYRQYLCHDPVNSRIRNNFLLGHLGIGTPDRRQLIRKYLPVAIDSSRNKLRQQHSCH